MAINNYKIPLIISLGIFLYGVMYYYSYTLLPLTNDEFYYAAPGFFDSLISWTHTSFGHPPGWSFLINLSYMIFGQSPVTAHITSLVLNMLMISILYFTIAKYSSPLYAIIPILLTTQHLHFTQGIVQAFPVILSTTAGILAILLYANKKYTFFTIFIIVAILIRESALVFILAAIFINFEYKKIKYFILPIFSILFFYTWYYFAREHHLINHAVIVDIELGKQILEFNPKRMLSFYTDYLSKTIINEYSFTFILILLLTSLFLFFYKKTNYRIIGALLFCFLLHSLFFSAYYHRGYRDTFMSTVTLFCAFPFILNAFTKIRLKKLHVDIFALICILFLIYSYPNSQWHSENFANKRSNHAKIIKQVEKYIKESSQKLNTPDSNILIAGEFGNFLKNPYMGHITQKLETNIISYYGRYEISKIPDKFIIILFSDQYTDEPFFEIQSIMLKEFAMKNNFKLIDTLTIKNKKTNAYIYKSE